MNRTLALLLAVALLAPLACARRLAAPPVVPSASAEQIAIGELLQRMHWRLDLMHAVARVKWNAQARIFDPERERALLEDVVNRGRTQQLDPEVTRAFFAAQMEAAKIIQEEDFQRWRADSHPPFEDVSDLAMLRKQIDTLNGTLLVALAEAWPLIGTPDGQRLLEAREAELFADLSAEARAAALRPLRQR